MVFLNGMKILVTNDDGIDSRGLKVLAKALAFLGRVSTVAPDRERSAASHALTLHKPLRVSQRGPRRYSINGTPTDCVNLAANGILRDKPDLVISGINKGANLGDDVTYSGTVSAAMEGTLLGIPSIAVSQAGEAPFHFETATAVIVKLVRLIKQNGLPPDTLLNVNVPNVAAGRIRGIRMTRLGKRLYDHNSIIKKKDPRNKTYYWIGGNREGWEPGRNTDHQAIESSHISITPIHLDLTNYQAIRKLRKWEELLNRI